jgi:hypothetical protein
MAEKCVCVCFGQRKRLVSFSSSSPGTDLDKLKEASLAVFPSLRSGRPIFQQYSPDFEEWLDMDDDAVIDHKSKITVVLEVNLFGCCRC